MFVVFLLANQAEERIAPESGKVKLKNSKSSKSEDNNQASKRLDRNSDIDSGIHSSDAASLSPSTVTNSTLVSSTTDTTTVVGPNDEKTEEHLDKTSTVTMKHQFSSQVLFTSLSKST